MKFGAFSVKGGKITNLITLSNFNSNIVGFSKSTKLSIKKSDQNNQK
jgi:hypothetical protein